MDLYAYANIDRLEEIAKKNNIVVPRLRGLRLMSEEELVPENEIKEDFRSLEVYECERLIRAIPLYKVNSNCLTLFYVITGRFLWRRRKKQVTEIFARICEARRMVWAYRPR